MTTPTTAAPELEGPEAKRAVSLPEAILRKLNLLPQAGVAQDGFRSAFSGPPESVALLEAGATAFAKWWSLGLGAILGVVWTAVTKFYNGQSAHPETQRVLLWIAGIATVTLVAMIALILITDLRGRVAVQLATINARVEVARTVLETRTTTGAGGSASEKRDEPPNDPSQVTPQEGLGDGPVYIENRADGHLIAYRRQFLGELVTSGTTAEDG
jgi:hypothetical protein